MSDDSIRLEDTFEERDEYSNAENGTSNRFEIEHVIPLSSHEYYMVMRGKVDASSQSHTNEIQQLAADSCPPEYYEGSSACDGICVWLVADGSYSICCVGCIAHETACKTPGSLRQSLHNLLGEMYKVDNVERFAIAVTLCNPVGRGSLQSAQLSLPDSVHEVAKEQGRSAELQQVLASATSATTSTVYIKVQSVFKPSEFKFFGIDLNTTTARLNLLRIGWFITITPNLIPVDPSSTVPHTPITPHPTLTPTAGVTWTDEAYSAMIIAPENGVAHQYWLTVPDSSRHPSAPYSYAHLTTPSWTITFLRLPSSAREKSECKCGCKEE